MIKRIASLLVFVVLLRAADAPWPTYGWVESTPAEQGMDSAMLEAGDEFIRRECPTRYSFLVIRNGYLVFERYYRGQTRYSVNHVASVSKSFLSALTGIALDMGYVGDLDRKMMDFYREYDHPGLDPRKREITIRHLLTMTAGFQWREFPDIYAWIQSRDWHRYVIELPLASSPGERFSYGSIMTHLFSGILTKATGRSAYDFGGEHLFDPLGIRNFYWLRDPMGCYVGGFQMFFTSRDIAKLGYLFLRDGVWEDRQVVPREWVEEATRLHVRNYSTLRLGDYGYWWWIKTARGHHVFAAIGYGGQYILVVPALNMIVVTTASDADDTTAYHSQAMTLLTDYAIEAVNPGQPEIAANGVVNSASYQPVIAPDSFMTIFGRNFAAVHEGWDSAISDGHLPAALEGVKVRIDGRECFVSYVGPTQVNVLVPPEVRTGNVSLDVSNRDGTASATVAVAQISPALFTYALDGKQHAAAVFAGEGVYVARTGAFQGVTSRRARPGDNLELYGAGLGATAQRHPVGEVLREPYPIADPASVHVFLGGSQALVQYVGMTLAGVYQINIQVPQDIPGGDLPVVVQVGEQATQPDVVLSFER